MFHAAIKAASDAVGAVGNALGVTSSNSSHETSTAGSAESGSGSAESGGSSSPARPKTAAVIDLGQPAGRVSDPLTCWGRMGGRSDGIWTAADSDKTIAGTMPDQAPTFHGLLHAVHHAFAYERDLELRPDDIFLQIVQTVAAHVNAPPPGKGKAPARNMYSAMFAAMGTKDAENSSITAANAERFREALGITHKGKKRLTVNHDLLVDGEARETATPKWEQVFPLFQRLIAQNTTAKPITSQKDVNPVTSQKDADAKKTVGDGKAQPTAAPAAAAAKGVAVMNDGKDVKASDGSSAAGCELTVGVDCASVDKSEGGEMVRLITQKFSTTTAADEVARQVALMDVVRSYFEFRVATRCGIPRIHLHGTVADWKAIADAVKKFGAALDLEWWSAPMGIILQHFVDAVANPAKIDVNYWNGVYKCGAISGGVSIDGWILVLMPYGASGARTVQFTEPSSWAQHKFVRPIWGLEDVASGLSRVEFTWDYLGKEKPMHLVAGYSAPDFSSSQPVRPRVAWAVVAR